jgi:hypothetical protein
VKRPVASVVGADESADPVGGRRRRRTLDDESLATGTDDSATATDDSATATDDSATAVVVSPTRRRCLPDDPRDVSLRYTYQTTV